MPKVVVGDAMQTQRNLSKQITDSQHGDYAWIAKDNQKHIRQPIELLFAPETPKPVTLKPDAPWMLRQSKL